MSARIRTWQHCRQLKTPPTFVSGRKRGTTNNDPLAIACIVRQRVDKCQPNWRSVCRFRVHMMTIWVTSVYICILCMHMLMLRMCRDEMCAWCWWVVLCVRSLKTIVLWFCFHICYAWNATRCDAIGGGNHLFSCSLCVSESLWIGTILFGMIRVMCLFVCLCGLLCTGV